MKLFKNVLEDIVIRVARELMASERSAPKHDVELAEVAAYALNRLPPLYATSQQGWDYQYAHAQQELREEIFSQVRRALHVVRLGDPLHDSQPLPENELSSRARALTQLQQLLGSFDLRWRDVPATLKQVLAANAPRPSSAETRIQEDTHLTAGNVAPRTVPASAARQRVVTEVKAYLDRKRLEDRQCGTMPRSGDRRELESYVLIASLGMSNVLEKLAILVAQHMLRHAHPLARARVDLGEVAAYALNRLPAMYATTDRGYKILRQRAQSEMAREITARVRCAILKIAKSPRFGLTPITLAQVDREYDAAIVEIKQLLLRHDLNWQNLAEVVRQALGTKP